LSWNWSKVFRFLVIALLPLTILVIVLMMLSNILLPFLVGLGAAYLLDPLADRLERLRFSRIAATSIIAIGVFLVLALVLLILLPPLATQTAQLAAELPGYVEGLRDRVLPAITRLMERFSVTSDLSATGLIKEQSGRAIAVGVDWASGLLQSSVAFLNLISLLIVTPIVTFYMLRDWDRMIAKVQSLVPPDHRQTYEKLGDQIDEVLAGFIRGQGLVCSFLAVLWRVTRDSNR
jgi:predicted PurR-regulated permease PerM